MKLKYSWTKKTLSNHINDELWMEARIISKGSHAVFQICHSILDALVSLDIIQTHRCVTSFSVRCSIQTTKRIYLN